MHIAYIVILARQKINDYTPFLLQILAVQWVMCDRIVG